MTESIDLIESILGWLSGIVSLGTLTFAIINMLRVQKLPVRLETGAAKKVLRTPYLIAATVLFLILAYVIWIPLPFRLGNEMQLALTVIGTALLLPSLGLYLWGYRSLGHSFNVSSGFGVRLQQGHALVTSGPYAYLRHPMYLAVIVACWGGLLLYRTWTVLIFAVMMTGLFYRGHKEEEAMALAYGSQWEEYKRVVPGWLPKLKSVFRKDKI